MKNILLFAALLFAVALRAAPAPDFTVTTSDNQMRQLYAHYINQQKLVVIEAFFTTCPPCATHAPLFQSLYTSSLAAYPGQIEFMLLSTLGSDTNTKVAQYKIDKGLTMPGAGANGGSQTALQPYTSGQFGPFEGTPTFIVIAPGTGEVFFDIRGNSAAQTIALLEQKIAELLPQTCKIEDYFGSGVAEATVQASTPMFSTFDLTDDNGAYSFSAVPALQNATYTVRPSKEDNPFYGMSTYDLVLIAKHILGIEPFLCEWQLIAADVNCNGAITSFDIVTARKYLLGITTELPCGAWRFQPDSAVVSNGGCEDFKAVEVGNVNAGPCDSVVLLPTVPDRSEPLVLHVSDRHLAPGETARVAFFLGENARLEGLQLALGFDPKKLKINRIESERLSGFDESAYSLARQSQGELPIVWLDGAGLELPAGATLLTLELTALEGGQLADWLRLEQHSLRPEAYAERRARPLEWSWQASDSPVSIAPNPARDAFFVTVEAERAADFWVQVLDLQGRTAFERRFPAAQGSNRWEIRPPTPNAGIYLLKINGEAAGKVILEGR
jgi:hypothetical protein